MDITDRIALVTGGATRVGRALTYALAEAGADVFVHYNSSAGPAEKMAEDVRGLGRRSATGAANLSDPSAAGDLIAQAEAALGPVSILVNSASGFPEDTLMDVELDRWHDTLNLTLASPIFLTQAFARALPDDMEGAVVNVTDVKTQTPYLKRFSYMIAKGGIDTFTRAAALALAPRIRVNAVALGVILPPPGEGDDYAAKLASRLPLQRVGGTDPVAGAVVALVENDFVTGEILRLDGGGHLV
ncbi:MAG TPA: SDR family oxidoreductase [Acidimicrobiia bacterium]|nr:SDR family oxidoreductase [Acidimicrobiia bacterium]